MNLIVLCAIGKYMAVTFPFLMATLVIIQLVYLRTSRQVRLLDIEAKAPLYIHFVETIDGITSMRAFGWRRNFQVECNRRINQSQRPFYMLLCLQQWLNLILNLVIAVMAVVLMTITTSLRDEFSAGSMGVALNLVLNLNQVLVHAIEAWTQLETSIGAVSRVQSFQKDTPLEDKALEQAPKAQDWPTVGAIAFENLTAAYQ
jgi:ABC-type multidrug transport system fused ATPase/permease subunit